MRKTKVIFALSLALLLILSSSAAIAAPQTIDLQTMTLDQLQALQGEVEDAIDAASATEDVESSDDDTEYEATRQNPAPIGATVHFAGDQIWNPAEIDITVTKVIRGEAAWAMVKKFNRFNSKPGKGNEYMIAYVNTKALPSDSDEKATINGFSFLSSAHPELNTTAHLLLTPSPS